MSVRDAHSRLATSGEIVIILSDSGPVACLGSMDDVDYIIQDEVLLDRGLIDATSPTFSVFKDCGHADKLAVVLYGTRPNVVLARDMSEYHQLQMSMKRIMANLKHIGKLTVVLLELVDDSVPKPTTFLTRALALTNNLPFGCERIQLADRALMHLDTHNMHEVWMVSSTPQARTMSVPPVYKMLRLMVPGVDVDKVIFTKPQVRSNLYALQGQTDLINGLLTSIGLSSNDVYLLPGTDPKNSKLFFAKLNFDRVHPDARCGSPAPVAGGRADPGGP